MNLRRALAETEQSTDPVAVFAALATVLAPGLCDAATVKFVGDPGVSSEGVAFGVVDGDHANSDNADCDHADGDCADGCVVVHSSAVLPCTGRPGWFTATITVRSDPGPAEPTTQKAYLAEMRCRWRGTPPSTDRLLLVEVLCERAAAAVLHARYRAAVAARDNVVAHLRQAVISNRTIGAAVGVLMTGRHLTYDQALQTMVEASSHLNRKMAALADEVLYTGDLPT